MLTDVIGAIGAKHYFMDVGEHDSFVSAVNHLPFLLSVALVGCTSKSPSWDDIAKMASMQYGNLTSLASGDPRTSTGIFFSDNQGVVYWIDAFIEQMREIRTILTSEEDGKLDDLEKVCTEAFEARLRWQAGVVTPASQAAMNRDRLPSASEGLGDLFLGNAESRRRLFGRGGGRDRDTRGKR